MRVLDGYVNNPDFSVFDNITREVLKNEAPKALADLTASLGDRKLIVLDVGGYFAVCLRELGEHLQGRLHGIVEDTENGHQRYESAKSSLPSGKYPCPILSAARSPLKEPEDHLVGQSIVYSTERILRDNDSLLMNKRVLVIGYGKIGRSIASSLSVRNIAVWVYDQDPVRRAQALSHGFFVPNRDRAIAEADLIFGATGARSLKAEDFTKLKANCSIASVTSVDDEFILPSGYATREDKHRAVTVYMKGAKTFQLLNHGNAINFTHSNHSLGPYVYLVGCELIGCVARLIHSHSELPLDEISALPKPQREEIANLWIGKFGGSAKP